MKNKIINIIKYALVFLLYYSFPYIFDFLLEILNVNLENFSRTALIVFIYIMEIIPLLFLVFIYRKQLKNEFKEYKKDFYKNIDDYLRLWLFALILMTLSNSIISIFTQSDISNNEEAVRNMTDILPLYSLFSTCIAAPIGEELAYRKTIGNIFSNKSVAIAMSGIIFGLAHVIGTYTGIIDLLYIIPYGLFGSVFMYMYLKSNSIWTTITIHFIHNTSLMILYFIR